MQGWHGGQLLHGHICQEEARQVTGQKQAGEKYNRAGRPEPMVCGAALHRSLHMGSAPGARLCVCVCVGGEGGAPGYFIATWRKTPL
jgi:hypothetical protein